MSPTTPPTIVRSPTALTDLAAALRLLEAADRLPHATATAMRAAAWERLERVARALPTMPGRPVPPPVRATPLEQHLVAARQCVRDDVAWLGRAVRAPERWADEQVAAIVTDLLVNLGLLVRADRVRRRGGRPPRGPGSADHGAAQSPRAARIIR